MHPARKKDYADIPEDLRDLAEAQDSAVEMIKTHLAEPLKKIEAKGYSRAELATAYLMLAYHALRHNESKDKADKAFEIIAHFAKRRIENNIAEAKKKRIFH